MADAAWVSAWAPAVPPSSCPIRRLPLEVLIRIAAWLTTPQLCAFRLTCRAIEELLYVTFTNEFFTRKQFMITENSLQALIDISKSRLAVHLRFVHIGLDRFPEGIRRPLADDEKERNFKKRYSDYFVLWNTGCHREMLSEAFRNLPNLEDVVIRDSNSRKRSRDGPSVEWTSYGSTTIFNETGIRLSQVTNGVWGSGFPFQGCCQLFALVLHALGMAGASPKGIEVLARNGNHLRDFSFNIPRFIAPSVLPVLHRLEKLHLSIDLSWRTNLPARSHATAAPTGQLAPDALLRRFLSHTTSLKDLRINEHHDYNPALTDFLEWLAEKPPSATDPSAAPQCRRGYGEDSPPPVAMPYLEALSLGTMNVCSPTLLRVIRKFAPSLQSLGLWRITLQRPLPLDGDPNEPPRCIFWVEFMNQLRQLPCLNLRHLTVGMMNQAYAHRPKNYFVSFKKHGPVVKYTGPHWKDFIDEVTPLLDVKWPRTVTPENGDDDDSDDDDDQDDDDDDLEGEFDDDDDDDDDDGSDVMDAMSLVAAFEEDFSPGMLAAELLVQELTAQAQEQGMLQAGQYLDPHFD